MPRKDRLVFRRVVPRAARAARRVLTVSERTRDDLVRLYGLPEEKVVVTPNGVDPAFTPGNSLLLGTYVLAVGAVQPRKNQLAALAAAEAGPLPLVVAGPVKDEALATRLRDAGADLRGYVSQEELAELYRGAACLVQPSHFEGFGLPMLEAMASGTPVVALDEPALREVGGDAAVFVDEAHLADGMRRALDERDELAAAGLERATGVQLARDRGADARGLPGGTRDDGLRGRRLARPRARARGVAARAGASGRRAPRDREPPGQRRGASCRGARAREPAAAHVRSERERRRGGNDRRVRARVQSGRGARAGRGRGARRASPTHTRAPASSARSSSGRTAPGSRRSAASRTSWARSGAERRSGSCVVPTSTRRPTTARARPSRCRATGCSAAPAC